MIQVDATLIDTTCCVVSQPSPFISKKVASQHHDAVLKQRGERASLYERLAATFTRRPKIVPAVASADLRIMAYKRESAPLEFLSLPALPARMTGRNTYRGYFMIFIYRTWN